MSDVEKLLEGLQRDGLWLQTAIGPVHWRPDAGALGNLLKPVRDALEAADAQWAGSDARFIVASYFRFFLVGNFQDAARQAAKELVALAKAKASGDKHERDQIARDAAEAAREGSLDRLRFTGYFPKPTRGVKKEPTPAERMRGFLDERDMFLLRLQGAITKRLRQKMRPTLSNVAALMNMGRVDTGGKLLGAALRKWIDPHEKPKKILDGLVEEIKNRTFDG